MLTIFLSAALILGLFLFLGTLKYLYPESSRDGYAVDVITRLKTITQKSETYGYGSRTASWQRSLKLIEEHPLLGVGIGNWKIEILKYEGPTTGAYVYMYKNHNDFIETTADTGIFGGALFLGIFVLIFANFIKAFFKAEKAEEDSYKWLFLPAFGLFCYSFDAMFNFPSNRPEIISFFAIFVGAGIAFSPPTLFGKRQPSSGILPSVTLITLFLSFMFGSIYIFYLNFESLKLQRIPKEEMKGGGMLTSKSELFLNGFPAIPDISIEGEPIACLLYTSPSPRDS